MTVPPTHRAADEDSMGQAKSRFLDVLCPGPSGDSRSSDGFGAYHEEEDDDEVALATSCCRGGLRGGYSSAVGDEIGLAETQMVVLRDRQTAGESGRRTTLLPSNYPISYS